VALVFGLLGSAPFTFYQLWQFLAPGLTAREKKILRPMGILSGVFFTAGSLFGYFVVLPSAFEFISGWLLSYDITLLPRMEEYSSFVLSLLLIFGVSFEFPLFLWILVKMGLLSLATLRHARRYIILGCFVAAAFLTPGPDVLSQCLLAIPLWILYELTLVAISLSGLRDLP
jgi:sec-independent protein translocase protein TatC